MTNSFSTIVVGGGAAGFFAALAAKEAFPEQKVLVLEKNLSLLAKVRVSGGGRCNVTHACFNPKVLVQYYPRGSKELLGPFHTFNPKNTVDWFESKGIFLKTELDGRMFPKSDSSQTIIDCFLNEAHRLGVEVRTKQKIDNIVKSNKNFLIELKDGEKLSAQKLIVTTGSAPWGHALAEQFGHHIEKPVPSLFTFNSPTSPLKELSGVSIEEVRIQIKDSPHAYTGPLLITHFGFSGPAILKLSAWAARLLNEKKYKFEIVINWLNNMKLEDAYMKVKTLKQSLPSKTLFSQNLFYLPKKLWKTFLARLKIDEQARLNDISQKQIQSIANMLCFDTFEIEGKTTHKDEFVTCGGVSLKEINFKTMESKLCPGLYFAGEILDIDGITGGFNFQNAWTTGYLAGSASS